MMQTSEWLGFDEMFELTERGVISCLEKKIEFIDIFEMSRHSIASTYEKKLINNAKKYFNSILNDLQDFKKSSLFLEEDYVEVMDEIHKILNNIIEFTEYEFLN